MQTDPWAGLGAPRTPLSSLKQDESFPRWLTFPELLEGEGKGSGWGVCCGEGRGGEGTGRKGYLTWSPQCPICLTKGDLGSSRPPPPGFCAHGEQVCCWHRVLSTAALPPLVQAVPELVSSMRTGLGTVCRSAGGRRWLGSHTFPGEKSLGVRFLRRTSQKCQGCENGV